MSALVDGLVVSTSFDESTLPVELHSIPRFSIESDDAKNLAEGLYLFEQSGELSLRQVGKKAPGPVTVDFLTGAVAHRRKYGGGKGQAIAKAVGVSSAYKPSVLDVTAGLGRDAFVLATLGCRVDMVERHPVVYSLLNNGLQRAKHGEGAEEIADIVERMTLRFGHGPDVMSVWLASVKAGAEQPDIVYLDPMFPHSKSTADVKKEMKVFRALVGADLDEADLFQAAFELARCRVVVKRPKGAPDLANQEPSYVLAGKANRFDIYTKQKVAAIAAT